MSAQVAINKMKMGYRRAESDPANTSVNDIRCKFESTSDGYTSPEVGLAFGVKKSTPCSTPTSDAPSPLVPRKSIVESIIEAKSSMPQKQSVKQTSDTKLEKLISKPNKHTSIIETPMDKYKKATVKPNSLIIPNGTQSLSKQLPIDKLSLIGLHNTGIVSSRKQQISSPITSPTVVVPCSKVNRLKTECAAKAATPAADKGKTLKPTTPINNKKVTKTYDNKSSTLTSTISSNNNNKESNYRHSMVDSVTSQSLQTKQDAKAFWKSVSVECDSTSSSETSSRVDSVFEPGMDYTKLRKGVISAAKNAKERQKVSSSLDKDKPPAKITPKTVQLTANNLRKVSESLSDYKPTPSEDSKSTSTSLSKSPSVSSTCSSMDSLEIDYINSPFSHRVRRRDTRPPQNIVARRTQIFEKSLDEINAVQEEADAYNKVKEAGFGTAFTTASTSSTQTKPRTDTKSKPADVKTSNGKPITFLNNNTKLADKNASDLNATEKEKRISSAVSNYKPLPALPITANNKHSDKSAKAVAALKPKPKGPPPKPPRTFEHPAQNPSFNDATFDPVVIPRQAGDGEENHGYESHVSCLSHHVYTSVTASDTRPYATTTSIDTRPYTSLTTTGGSGGDDSVAGSENAYDTLGRVSVASSYEHYDTISASELDSDISRPPTLPRRPSNLRHRPLTTAFSHMDLSRNSGFQNQLQSALSANASTIKETSPTSPSPTKIKVPFKLKYLLPKARRKADEMRKASSMADLLDDKDDKEVLYDSVQIKPSSMLESSWSGQTMQAPDVPLDEAGYALPDIKGSKRQSDSNQFKHGEPQQAAKSNHDKASEKIRLKLNQAFSALRRHVAAAPLPTSDGEDDENAPDPEVLEERLKHCTIVKEHAIYASVEQIKGFMTRIYAQLYDYAVIVALRKNPDTNIYEPYVKYKFPPQLSVEQTTIPQFCYPDAHIWHKTTDYKSEAFSFVLTDVTGTRQYGYCKRLLPPDLNNLPRTPEVICVVSPLRAPKLYNQVLDEVERRRMQSSIRAEEFLQAVYGRPLPSPGQSVTIRAMDVYEEPESLVFKRSPDSQREGIDYECLLNLLSVSQIIKIFASILLERKIIFIAEKLSILSSCVHAFASLIYPFSWQHTFIPLLPPNLIDVVCAPTPYIVGLLSSNANLLSSLDDEMEEVLVIDLDNHKLLQRIGDEKSILPKKLHRALTTALDMAKSESQNLRSTMVAEAFLRFFLETTGGFNHFMIHVPHVGRQFQKEEFVSNASNAPSIMVFLQWFTATQMFEVYTTERENDRNIISGTFEERVFEFQSEDHEELLNDSKIFKKFKLFGKNKRK